MSQSQIQNISGTYLSHANNNLTDISGTYISHATNNLSLEANKYLAVNSEGTSITFTDPPQGGGSSTFVGLSDTPSSLTANKYLGVDPTGTSITLLDANNNLTDAMVDDIIVNSKLQITNPNTDKAIEIYTGGSVDRSDLTGGTFVDLSNVQSPQYKRTIYKINVNNTTEATATYFIDTGLGDKDIFNITFTYKRNGFNYWENSRDWTQYIRYHSGGSLQGKIALLNISAGQQMVGYITLEYINL